MGKIIVMLNHQVQCQYCPKDVKNCAKTEKGKRKGSVDEVDEESGLADNSIGHMLRVDSVESNTKRKWNSMRC